MADALVYAVLEQLASIMNQEIQQEVSLVRGVETEVQKLTSSLQTIRAVLVDAEKRQVTEEVVKIWLEKLKDISYDMHGALDEWSTAILKHQIEGSENTLVPRKVCSYISSPCFCFSRVILHHDIAVKIKGLNERLDVIASEKDKYKFKSIMNTEELERQKTTSFVNVSEVYGRDKDKETIVSELLGTSSRGKGGLHIISIVGMGGIGKTTLAQLAYNDDDVKAHFEKRLWVCVSDPFDELRIAKEIAIALDGSDPSVLDWKNLPRHIHESISGKKFLLVLDDVWTEDFKKWEALEHSLRSGDHRSRILVTTRNERVAKMMGTTYTHPLEELSKELCRSLFSQIAFFGRRKEDCVKLEEIGRKIADKCKGLPLAAKTLGSHMRLKENEQDWQNVLDSEWWELEEVEKRLFPPLLLSYYDLPSSLKQCFLYCAIFPKDHVIETDKLIQLWMAQGYLSSRRSIEMEILGREYFENLVMRSFFQDFVRDEYHGSITSCKMHDIVHDFAQFLTKNECFIMEVGDGKEAGVDSSYRMGRHSTVILAAEASFPVSIYNRKNLHTLLVIPKVNTGIANALLDFFHYLKCLRALDLRDNSIRKLPREVGNLMHLRYLNLSANGFEKLPETVCDLCNLLTLDLSCCYFLKELPKGMGKLLNLRHLEMYGTSQLRFLPKGIRRLSSLRTLREFIVAGGDDREACALRDLENLKNLKGFLRISGLGNVGDASEAEKAELKCKKNLLHLDLKFNGEGAEGKMDDLIKALQPHPNLELLGIWDYRGTLFPSWIMSLTKLRNLNLSGCSRCRCLPPLGKLPSLESLEIESMTSLKKVGVEFLGLRIDDNDGITAGKDDRTEASAAIVIFPKLKKLTFSFMEKWEDWNVKITRRKEEEEIVIMPCLRSLTIQYCRKLRALSNHLQTAPLEELYIIRCPILKQRCQQGTGEEWSKISHVPKIYIQD